VRLRITAITAATAVALVVVSFSSAANADSVKPVTRTIQAAKTTTAKVSSKKVATKKTPVKKVPAKKTAAKPKVVTTPVPTPTPSPSPYLYPQPTDIADIAPAQHAAAAAVIEFVKSQLGKSYVLGGTGPTSYDCSGLMLTAWKNVGVELPRTSGQQYLATIHIKLEDIKPGDLVFFGKAGNQHVALYMGDNKVLDAASLARGVTYSDLSWPWYTKNFAGVGRIPTP